MRSNCLNIGKRGKRNDREVRGIININQSILTSLTSLTSISTLACEAQLFSSWYSKFPNLTSTPMFFRGKRGKEVRGALPLLVSLLPLEQLLPLPGGKR